MRDMKSKRSEPLYERGIEVAEDCRMEPSDEESKTQIKWIEKMMGDLSINSNFKIVEKAIKTKKQRKRGNRKKTKAMIEEKNRIWREKMGDWMKQMNDKRNIKAIKNKQNIAQQKKLDEARLLWYGDKIKKIKSLAK